VRTPADPLDISLDDARSIDRAARRVETPCGNGSMVWRGWGESAQTILLLHGGSGSWIHWIRNIQVLSTRYTVWAPDFPGMGESADAPEPWTPQIMADITQSGLQQILGERPVDVVGFSFGAMIGGFLAAGHRDRVRSLVLVDAAGTGVANDPGHRMRSWRNVPDPWQRKEIHRHNLAVFMLHDPALANPQAAELVSFSVESDRLRNRQVSRTDALLKILPQVSCPIFAIWGREDVLFTRTRDQLSAALQAAGVRSLCWLADAGHWAPFEKPSEFNATLLELLDSA
jgi:2-hydroxy-6-oxonona-2,4-dienedioate hydrolase